MDASVFEEDEPPLLDGEIGLGWVGEEGIERATHASVSLSWENAFFLFFFCLCLELGIYPEHIYTRTKTVLNPFSATSNNFLEDRDVAGPLVFCLLLGVALLMTGKMYLGYIYGIGTIGSLGM